jgi:hypothetical protein
MPKHIATSFFETLVQALAKSLQNLLEQYDLTKKITTYVKYVWVNLMETYIYVSIKFTQTYLQKSITWPKTLGKRRYEWMKACVIASLKAYKIEHTNQNKM